MQNTKSKSRSYRDLEVWKLAIILVKEVYLISKKFPSSENFGLTNQIRRAAVSIPANVAESRGRNYAKEFRQFPAISLGSIAELATQLIIAKKIEYLTLEELNPFLDPLDCIGKLKGLSKGIS